MSPPVPASEPPGSTFQQGATSSDTVRGSGRRESPLPCPPGRGNQMGARTLLAVGALGTRSATGSPPRVGEGPEEGTAGRILQQPRRNQSLSHLSLAHARGRPD